AGALPDELRVCSERRGPRSHVRRLAARARMGDRGRIRSLRERLVQAHDDVEPEVAERADQHLARSSQMKVGGSGGTVLVAGVRWASRCKYAGSHVSPA